jgi:hypothetical protein
MAVQVTTYKVRGGQITSVNPNCQGTGVPTFIMQTFGVDKTVVDIDSAKTELLASSDMQGQKLGDLEDQAYIDSTYSSASYSGRPLRTTDGDLVFNATESHVVEFAEEEIVGL